MLATSQEFLFMLASPANQSCVADSQGQAANLLALDVSGTQHEPVLLDRRCCGIEPDRAER